jgi:hypothetical protein
VRSGRGINEPGGKFRNPLVVTGFVGGGSVMLLGFQTFISTTSLSGTR